METSGLFFWHAKKWLESFRSRLMRLKCCMHTSRPTKIFNRSFLIGLSFEYRMRLDPSFRFRSGHQCLWKYVRSESFYCNVWQLLLRNWWGTFRNSKRYLTAARVSTQWIWDRPSNFLNRRREQAARFSTKWRPGVHLLRWLWPVNGLQFYDWPFKKFTTFSYFVEHDAFGFKSITGTDMFESVHNLCFATGVFLVAELVRWKSENHLKVLKNI